MSGNDGHSKTPNPRRGRSPKKRGCVRNTVVYIISFIGGTNTAFWGALGLSSLIVLITPTGSTANTIARNTHNFLIDIKNSISEKIPLSSDNSEVVNRGDKENFHYNYTVRKRDNLKHICKQHEMTLKEVLDLNPQIKNPNKIRPGQKIKVIAWKIHEVQAGEFLTAIANQYEVSYVRIKAANKLKRNTISPGDILIIPYRDDNFQPYGRRDPRVK